MKTNAALLRIVFAALLTLALSLGLVPVTKAQQPDASNPESKKWSYKALTKVPEKDQRKTNPIASDALQVQAGGKLFDEHCSECHGIKAEGGKRGPSLLRSEVKDATPGALYWILSNGVIRHGMPDWSKLPEQERWQLVSFLESFKQPGEK